ncbi:MAG: tRNA (adenosine(37)-N6)-dimethylallyltransferase MiaA [Schleiferiaceae bacterium]|nr:tRNA (adenosine(37)-N6)-dimethylallyltransferase MiaA [Schleiferiaceae bacterium]
MNKPLLIAICGPTASGKTALSIELAKWLGTEILSFDSRQFYKELQIGAAPPSPEEQAQVKHHFIQHISVKQDYNAGQYERDAIVFLGKYFQNKKNIVTVGGSGMYIKALEEGFDDLPDNVQEVRTELNSLFAEKGIEPLQKELAEKDPVYFAEVDQQNHVRLIRALEVIRTSGKTYSEQRSKPKKDRPFTTIKIGVDYPREELYKRINLRVDLMMEAGLLEEAKNLYPLKAMNSLQTVGYTELFKFFDGEWDLEFAVSEIKKNSRRYAKRQMTWFRKDTNIHWIKPGDIEAAKKIIAPYI